MKSVIRVTVEHAATHPYGWNVYCRACQRGDAKIDQERMRALAALVPISTTIDVIEARLICTFCGEKHAVINRASP